MSLVPHHPSRVAGTCRFLSVLLLILCVTSLWVLTRSIVISLQQGPVGHQVTDSPLDAEVRRNASDSNELLISSKPVSLAAPIRRIRGSSSTRQRRRPLSSPTRAADALIEVARFHQGVPIMDTEPSVDSPIPVRVLLFDNSYRAIQFRESKGRDIDQVTKMIGDEVLNIVMNGMEQSPYFALLPPAVVPDDPTFWIHEEQDTVWVVDMRRYVFHSGNSTLTQLATLVNQTLRLSPQPAPSIKVVLMDFRDRLTAGLCYDPGMLELQTLLGDSNVRLVAQQLVAGRKWDDSRNFTNPGNIMFGNPAWNPCFSHDMSPLHVPYTVRTDYAAGVLERFTSLLPPEGLTTSQVPMVPDTVRPVDIAHFWNVEAKEPNANLRNHVSQTVRSMDDMTLNNGAAVRAVASSVSSDGRVGRTSFQEEYVGALMNTKIVVVAQRDSHEDHYRLMEALVGGAMVMTDPMLSLPPGYINGTNIITYTSLEELERLALHYLNNAGERLGVARRGWSLAMNRHRTFHWMEEIFFGKAITNISGY